MKLDVRIKWIGKRQPLAVTSNGEIIAYKSSKFYEIKGERGCKKICDLNQTFVTKCKEYFTVFRRLTRQEIRCQCINDKNEIFFFKNHSLYMLDPAQNEVKRIYTIDRHQAMPLNIALSSGKYIVVWGEYGKNQYRGVVSIYGLTRDKKVKIAYQFAQGTIRHIHNIILDGHGGYIIFTGDNDSQAGIYHANSDFSRVLPLYTGEQQARAVIGFQTKEGLLYATDSVESLNYICLMKWDVNEVKVIENKRLCKINGSCIYGVECKDGYIFSTTVEPTELQRKNLLTLFSAKRGRGILSEDVHIVHVGRNYQCRVIAEFKKDKLPPRLFQYGAVRFPANQPKGKKIVIYPWAVKRVGGKLGIMEMNID